MTIRIRNWAKFQHYKFRKPPWIKLYREVLDDPDWHNLSGESAKGLIMLWLIASEEDGYLPDSRTLAFRLRISENRVIALLSDCSAWFEEDASMLLASRYQHATPETETETETEEEKTLIPTKTVGTIGSVEFMAFWAAYPRKLDRKETLKAWVKGILDRNLGAILAGLEAWKQTEQWKEVDKIPYPSTWLNKRRWEEPPQKGMTKNEQKRQGTRDAIERVRRQIEGSGVAGQVEHALQSAAGRATD